MYNDLPIHASLIVYWCLSNGGVKSLDLHFFFFFVFLARVKTGFFRLVVSCWYQVLWHPFLFQEEQFMYPSSLENESFIVALVNCRRQGYGQNQSLTLESNGVPWEIARAQRCDSCWTEAWRLLLLRVACYHLSWEIWRVRRIYFDTRSWNYPAYHSSWWYKEQMWH